jgi:hypothetical protein
MTLKVFFVWNDPITGPEFDLIEASDRQGFDKH